MAITSFGAEPLQAPRAYSGGLGGFYNENAAKAGVSGTTALNYGSMSGLAGLKGSGVDFGAMLAQILQQGPQTKAAPTGGTTTTGNFGGVDVAGQLAKILGAGPQPDQGLLDASLGDINAQQTSSTSTLKNRFSGAGRPLSSTEYGSQETQLTDAFNRSRTAARANANTAGLANYAATTNPLLAALKMMNDTSNTNAAINLNQQNFGLSEYNTKVTALMNLLKLVQSGA